MLGAMYSGITGMDAASAAMDVVGNNIANVNTCAFKSGSISFASVYSDSIGAIGGSPGNEEGNGVQVVGLNSVWEQGGLETTMNPTDLGIQGDGFFQVLDDDGSPYYTRAGQFRYDSDSNLVDPDGRLVQGFAWDLGTGSAITSANTNIWIDESLYSDIKMESDGCVTAEDSLGLRNTLYQVSVFDFSNIHGLRKVTGNLYQESAESGSPLYANGQPSSMNGAGEVSPNSLEMSNVDLAREFVDLIVNQKAFQANSRVISSSSDMLSEVINIIR